jgi:hypothetical protein
LVRSTAPRTMSSGSKGSGDHAVGEAHQQGVDLATEIAGADADQQAEAAADAGADADQERHLAADHKADDAHRGRASWWPSPVLRRGGLEAAGEEVGGVGVDARPPLHREGGGAPKTPTAAGRRGWRRRRGGAGSGASGVARGSSQRVRWRRRRSRVRAWMLGSSQP